MSKVTVITATVGNPRLYDCIVSVANQNHDDVQHLVFVDGPERKGNTESQFEAARRDFPDAVSKTLRVVDLPYSVGKDRWNGHRMYAAGTFLADGEFVMWLDDDNTIEPDHITSLLEVCKTNDWAFSFRNIVDRYGALICKDECESLGKWASVLNPNDFFVDVNCYMIPTKLAIHLGPAWYRKFREPGQPEVDRVLSATLMNNGLKYDTTYRHTVNYTVGNTPNSVQKEFFLQGNAEMYRRYPNGLPWKILEMPL